MEIGVNTLDEFLNDPQRALSYHPPAPAAIVVQHAQVGLTV